MSETKRLTCPACGVSRPLDGCGVISAKYQSQPDERLLCTCGGCGFTWMQEPLFAVRDESKQEESNDE